MSYRNLAVLVATAIAVQGFAFAQQATDAFKTKQELVDIQNIMKVIERANLRQVDQKSAENFGNFIEWKDALFKTSKTQAATKQGITAPPKPKLNAY